LILAPLCPILEGCSLACLQIGSSRGTIILSSSDVSQLSARKQSMESGKTITLTSAVATFPFKRHTRAKMAIAFGVAAVSDAISIWITFAPPFQWALDLVTAFLLFLIFGRRWALLPGLAMEAIPGMGVFPWWVLVVLSIILYDGIKKPQKS
jgi:hypothetical protein